MAGRRIGYLLAWGSCVVFFYAYRLWFSWFLLILMLALPVFSLLCSLPAMLTAKLELEASAPVIVGTRRVLRLRCESRFPVAAWRCRIRVERPLTGESWTLKNGELLPTDHCGELRCTVVKGKVYDYLGLFALPVQRPEPVRVTVRPAPAAMGAMPAMKRQAHRAWRPKQGGGFAENHELRLYRPGDSIRQIHWKLSAKTGRMILREPMEPVRGRVLLRLDLRGTPGELDRLLGRLLWLGGNLLDMDVHFEIHGLSASGFECWRVTSGAELLLALDALLSREQALEGSVRDRPERASWQYDIGGGTDET